MAKKRSKARRKGTPRRSPAPRLDPRALTYKVVELSTVDESTLEHTVNEWVALGWRLDGVQFAMRESSKRPSMAFVFFTREGPPAPSEQLAQVMRNEDRSVTTAVRDAWERLRELATEGEDES